MRNGADYRLGPGMTSLLMVFVALCMAALALLTFASVKVDSNLNDRSEETVRDYYDTAADLQGALFALDEQLYQLRAEAAGDLSVYAEALKDLDNISEAPAGYLLHLDMPMGEERYLAASLQVSLSLTGPRYSIISHQVVNRAPWDAETDVGLYAPVEDDEAGVLD